MNTQPVLSFIGAGNMARAIVGGLLATEYPAQSIWVSCPEFESMQDLAKQGVQVTTDNELVVSKSDVVILAVKPQIIKPVCEQIAAVVQANKPLIISVAAGVMTASIKNWLSDSVPVIRCMPNTPALVQTGACALFASEAVNQTQKQQAESILNNTGLVLWVETENLLDAVTAVSGSGPAYCFLVMEAMIAAGEQLGLSTDIATELTLQTVLGAAIMAQKSDIKPAELRRRVTSPNGTTEQAIKCFIDGKLPELFSQAMQACYERSETLAKELTNA